MGTAGTTIIKAHLSEVTDEAILHFCHLLFNMVGIVPHSTQKYAKGSDSNVCLHAHV